MAVTIKDVAKEARVSIATVSMVLNDAKFPISDATKQKVLEAANKLNYVPNRIAQSLVKKKSNSIALIVPDITNPFYPEIAKAVSEVARDRGYSLLLINTDNDKNIERNSLDILENGFAEGALIISRDATSFIDEKMKSLVLKTVYMDESSFESTDSKYLVTGNSDLGGYIAGMHLIELGHTKLACITGPEDTPNSSRRLSGFLKACMENNIELKKDNILIGDYSFEGGYKNGLKLAELDVTAAFCFNDLSAYGTIKGIRSKGKSVPEDISIIGYDNLLMDKFIDPSLTTIDQFSKKIGTIGTKMLFDLIEGKAIKDNRILINPILVQGETTKKLL